MLCVGLLIVAFGVAFSILADLGTSPISCPPYVASMLCPLTVGEATIVMHCIFILIQMALLRKDYDWVQLMQLPVAFAFGYMTDFACWCIADVPCPNYLMQVVWCLVGIVLVGVGVAFEVVAGVVTLAGEGLVLAICKAFKTRFDITKVVVDVSLVALAASPRFSGLTEESTVCVREPSPLPCSWESSRSGATSRSRNWRERLV